MRRFISIFIVLCLVGPVMMMYYHLQHEKHIVRKQVKRQMIASMDRDELVYLSFSINDTKTKLRWEHSKEFEYEHQMYDIVESESRSDSVFYWCWWDHAETSLNKKLNGLVADIMQKDPQHQQKQSRMMDFFRSLFLPVAKQLYDVCTEPEQHDFFQQAHRLFSHHFPPLTPPPKII